MADNRKAAGEILAQANKTVMTERGSQHGDAENSFQMIADMWSAYLNNVHRAKYGTNPGIVISGQDVAHLMVQLKQARAIYGNAANLDHYVDAAGYTALAGMLVMPENMTVASASAPRGMPAPKAPPSFSHTLAKDLDSVLNNKE